jgi:hypothetical protein
MLEFFTRNPGILVALVAIIGGCLVAIISTMSSAWRQVRVAEQENVLKQEMLQRGMSAGEIERVLTASPTKLPTEPVSDNEYYLVEKLLDEGKSAEEIERVIRAIKPSSSTPPAKHETGSFSR